MNITGIDTTGFVSYNGHSASCMCGLCLSADMDAAAIRQGISLDRINGGGNGEDILPTRTRYATPGQKCGRGFVRQVSDRQVNYIKRLMNERDTMSLVRLPGSEDIERMSLKGACDLIDRLLKCPFKKNVPTVRPATDPMKNFLRKLIAERVSDETFNVDSISFDAARKAIDYLKSQPLAPKKAISAPTQTVGEGMYLKDGAVYKVQRAVHGSGHLYAKKFDTEIKKFEYAGVAPLRTLTNADRMTLEQAKNYSALYGVCIRCSKTLTKEESIERAMGDVCASKF